MRRCRCHGRRFCLWAIGATLSFPLEHLAWERLYPLTLVTRAVGL